MGAGPIVGRGASVVNESIGEFSTASYHCAAWDSFAALRPHNRHRRQHIKSPMNRKGPVLKTTVALKKINIRNPCQTTTTSLGRRRRASSPRHHQPASAAQTAINP